MKLNAMTIISSFVLAFSMILHDADAGIEEADEKKADSRVIEAAKGSNEFSFALYRRLAQSGGNVIIAPISISSAFTMLYAGSGSSTRNEIERVLAFRSRGDAHLSSWKALGDDISLRSRGGAFRFLDASRVWVAKEEKVKGEYLSLIKKYYNGGVGRADFTHQAEEARKEINKWASKNTQGIIKEIVPSSACTAQTRMMMINAVCFLGKWQKPFDPDRTFPADFYLTRTKKVAAQFMKAKGHYRYAETPELQMIAIPYQGGLSFVIILPKRIDGCAAIEKNMKSLLWDRLIAQMDWHEVNLQVPRFRSSSSFDLIPPLRGMGMNSAFSEKADFSGIAPRLYVNGAFHQAYIFVDEKGTEAAAATEIDMVKADGDTPVWFRADHPFMYAVWDARTGAILFIGRLADPTK